MTTANANTRLHISNAIAKLSAVMAHEGISGYAESVEEVGRRLMELSKAMKASRPTEPTCPIHGDLGVEGACPRC